MSIEEYFSNWKQRSWSCSQCSWSGKGDQADTELFSKLMEINCPQCSGRLAKVLLPTHEAIREAAALGNPEAVAMLDGVTQAEDFQADRKKSRRSLNRLPKIPGENLEFSLTTTDGRDWMNPSFVILMCNGEEIYRERSGYEHWKAVIKIGQAVLDQFGDRVACFDPADAGKALLGDNLSASSHIQRFLDGAGIAPPSGPWATSP